MPARLCEHKVVAEFCKTYALSSILKLRTVIAIVVIGYGRWAKKHVRGFD
jgi:hypothetical protein